MNIRLPSSIHHGKTIYYSAVSCYTNSSLLRFCSSLGPKCAASAKKDDRVASRRSPVKTRQGRQALNQLAITCNSKLSDEEGSPKRTNDDDKMRTAFLDVYYSVLKPELLDDPSFEWTADSRHWVEQMLDYNVPRGKLMRGLSVIDSYKILKLEEGKELNEDEVFDASILGWCIEWIQACLLIHDDIMDNSHTRRGQACWFRVPKVGMTAVNDGDLLITQVFRILKKHFREKPYYTNLLDLFNEVTFQTFSGQMLDSITTTGGEKNLSNYSMHLCRRIAQYKTGYHSFYLPAACALLLSGETLEKHVNVKDVLLDIGIYFQAVDDYMDCFGDPETTGEIGTDIEDFKCSWLIVKALELSNEEQKKTLYEHYGKANPSDVAKVKAVYNDINLQDIFAAYESECYEKIKFCVDAHPSKVVQAIWERYTIRTQKVYKNPLFGVM